MTIGVRFHDFEKILLAPIKTNIEFSVICDCIFGHYLVTPVWTYNHANFELVWESFPSMLLGRVLYVSFFIISFQ
jgi:hypothetical protein